MATYFTLAELLKSDTAKKRGIDNTPTFDVVRHLEELTEKVLDPMRAAWGKPIKVTSGYRCEKLNEAPEIKGSPTSVHLIGYAADLQTSGSFNKFRDFVVNWLKTTYTKFDQLLLERNAKTGKQWIHIGLYNNNGQQRGIIKVMEV